MASRYVRDTGPGGYLREGATEYNSLRTASAEHFAALGGRLAGAAPTERKDASAPVR